MGFFKRLLAVFLARPARLSDADRATVRRNKLRKLSGAMIESSDWAIDPKGYRLARKIDRDAKKRGR